MKTLALRVIAFSLFVFIFSLPYIYAQDSEPAEESIIDKVAEYIEIRKTFDSRTETTKPALFSYKKLEDEPAIYTVDAAVLYRKFDYNEFAIFPALQFLYTSGGKKKREFVEVSLFGLLFLYKNSEGKGRLEPSVSYSKDFFSEERILKSKILFNPSYDGFFIPIRNVTHYKFKYNGKDNHWVFGINPIVGFGYEHDMEEDSDDDVRSFYNVAMISASLKRYYLNLRYMATIISSSIMLCHLIINMAALSASISM